MRKETTSEWLNMLGLKTYADLEQEIKKLQEEKKEMLAMLKRLHSLIDGINKDVYCETFISNNNELKQLIERCEK